MGSLTGDREKKRKNEPAHGHIDRRLKRKLSRLVGLLTGDREKKKNEDGERRHEPARAHSLS